MAKDLFNWAAVLAAFVLGLGLVLQPNLISSLPQITHYLFGTALLAVALMAFWKMVK